jgi:hypothetical protein
LPSFAERLRTVLFLGFKRAQRQVRNRLFVPTEDFRQDAGKAGLTPAAFLAARRKAPRLYVEAAVPDVAALAARCPDQARQTLIDAERILRHEFNLLGSGPFLPVDPDRPARPSGYRPIDWYLDPVRDLRFPVRVPYKDWKLYEMRPPDADVKYPWELARSQHFLTLAQTFRLGGDPRFAREIFDEIADFMEANPVGFGINWTCTMDVAIRAANWAIGLALTLDAQDTGKQGTDEQERLDAYAGLFDHGRFIYENLENTYEVTSNHFLSNVIGLHFIAAEFGGLPQARLWDEFCRKALEREIVVQIHDEGADFESAVPYHRLVTELFLASGRLAQFQGRPLSADYQARLARMVEFLAGLQRPDGLMPVIGDADDGRFHIAARYGDWNRQDARHIYAPAALTLNRPDWLPLAGPDAAWEAAWWGFDTAAVTPGLSPAPDGRHLYPDVGIAVTRTGGNYLAITNGAVGTKGFGNHKHNELLGFEYHLGGAPLIVDPGSYVYTSDFAARNLFRATAYHNTVGIDGAEQNETNPEWIFRLFETANPVHESFDEADGTVTYVGSHTGYQRTDAKATHRRRFAYRRTEGHLVIEDTIAGEGEHRVVWHFHAAPGVTIAPDGDGFVLAGPGARARLAVPAGLEAVISDAWYSPSYGVKVPCRALDLAASVPLDGRTWRFEIVPDQAGGSA